ncbi:DUF6398 domain-containing protein [Methanobrevibacter filiformis]|uniref:DUF6398 domain-containing protein n=1 Tax=Methanobrevibacter filiformis TaxID=55758 RepID=A0A166DCT7_9EURY|nr:DUF6398 domain-containing protein [Methanobrevibacter filiformis]KZX15452.1 hypothetical protein MBFIL_06400 [Methanobrevibacter filiformis]
MSKEEIKVKETQLIGMVESFAKEYINEEYAELSVNLVKKLGRKREVPFKRGKLDIWASGVIYALGQVNFLFDKSFKPHVTPDEICGYFNTKKSTVGDKARTIREMLKLDNSKEFTTKHMINVKEDEEIIRNVLTKMVNDKNNEEDMGSLIAMLSKLSLNNNDLDIDENMDYDALDQGDSQNFVYDFIYVDGVVISHDLTLGDLKDNNISLDNIDFKDKKVIGQLDIIFEEFTDLLIGDYDEFEDNRIKFFDLKQEFYKKTLLQRGTDDQIEEHTIPYIKEFLDDINNAINLFTNLCNDLKKLPKEYLNNLEHFEGLNVEIKRVLNTLDNILEEAENFLKELEKEYFGYYDEIDKYIRNIDEAYVEYYDALDELGSEINKKYGVNFKDANMGLISEEELIDVTNKFFEVIGYFSQKFDIAIEKYNEDKIYNEEFKEIALEDIEVESKIREVDFDFIINGSESRLDVFNDLKIELNELINEFTKLNGIYEGICTQEQHKILNLAIKRLQNSLELLETFKSEINNFKVKLEKIEEDSFNYTHDSND